MAKQKVVYAVFRRGRKLKDVFSTYEQARSHARKYIRKMLAKDGVPSLAGWNPDIASFEISVKRVTA